LEQSWIEITCRKLPISPVSIRLSALAQDETGISIGYGAQIAMESNGITVVKQSLHGIAKARASATSRCQTSSTTFNWPAGIARWLS